MKIFWSAGVRRSHERLLITNGFVSYLWPVSVRYFCTSYSLADAMFASGFSWPSTTPCWSAT